MRQIAGYAKELKLPLLTKECDGMILTAKQEKWTDETFLCNMLEKEVEKRMENRRRQHVKNARFPQLKYLQELVREELPEDAKKILPQIETLDFIRTGRNIVLSGNPGTGKTHVSIGIGINACMEGYSVLFTSVPRLLTQLRESRSQKVLHQTGLRFEKYDLVICDEFGYVGCDKEGVELLFNHLSLRTGKKSTVITTNLAFDRWSEVIRDKILVAALVDRLTHKAFLVIMNGQSYRLKETK